MRAVRFEETSGSSFPLTQRHIQVYEQEDDQLRRR